MSEASFESLRKIQLQEKNYAALSVLEDDFFKKYRDLLAQQRERLTKDFSLDGAASLESMSRLLTEVVRRREQKLLQKAMRDFQAGEVDGTGLAAEERDIYNELIKLLGEYESKMLERKASPTKAQRQLSTIRLKFSVELPAFVAGNGEKLGPFAVGQVASVPESDGKLLIEQGVAQEA